MEWEQKIPGMAYIAIPYLGEKGQDCPMEDRELSFHVANKIAAYFLSQGEVVYSPITHSHPIHFYMNGMGNDHDLWMKYDEVMSSYCNRIYIICKGNWKKSKGVMREMGWFKRDKKPIFLIAVLEDWKISIAYPVGNTEHSTFPHSVEDRRAIVEFTEAKRA